MVTVAPARGISSIPFKSLRILASSFIHRRTSGLAALSLCEGCGEYHTQYLYILHWSFHLEMFFRVDCFTTHPVFTLLLKLLLKPLDLLLEYVDSFRKLG